MAITVEPLPSSSADLKKVLTRTSTALDAWLSGDPAYLDHHEALKQYLAPSIEDPGDALRDLMFRIGGRLGDRFTGTMARSVELPALEAERPLLVDVAKIWPLWLPKGWREELAPRERTPESICEWIEHAIEGIHNLTEWEMDARKRDRAGSHESGQALAAEAQSLAAHAAALEEAFLGIDVEIDWNFLDGFRSSSETAPKQAIDSAMCRLERIRDSLTQDADQAEDGIPNELAGTETSSAKRTGVSGNALGSTGVADVPGELLMELSSLHQRLIGVLWDGEPKSYDQLSKAWGATAASDESIRKEVDRLTGALVKQKVCKDLYIQKGKRGSKLVHLKRPVGQQ